MKNIIKIIATILLLVLTPVANVFAAEPTNSEVYIPSEDRYVTVSNLENLIYDLDNKIEACCIILDSCEDLGYETGHPTITRTKQDMYQLKTKKFYYNSILEEYKMSIKEQEYPIATKIWKYLKELGYNDYVAAGIVGNMMIETGGGTLHIKAEIYNETGNYYGLCQWSKSYYPDVHGVSDIEQLDYLASNIEQEFESFGSLYKDDFSFEDFLELEDEKQTALAFAKCYERCNSGSYKLRQNCATIALDYFTK